MKLTIKNLNRSLLAGFITFNLSLPVLAAEGDDPLIGMFILDKFETTDADGDSPLNWEVDTWLGKDLNKLWLKSEGEHIDGKSEQRNELLYSRAIASFWDVQLGWRQDRNGSESRDFASLGVQGLAPYRFDTSSSIVVGEDNQLGLTAQIEYEIMLTQRWVISPEIDFDMWSEKDPQMGIGSGLSTAEFGLRLRYEIRREFAPYIGFTWSKKYGDTANFAEDEGEDTTSSLFVAGLRIWF